MSSLRRDLVERKLWMVVAILVVAVVGAPVFLLKGASASTTRTVPAPPAATAMSAQTTTTTTAATASAEPAKVVLARIARDPFASGVPKLSSKPASPTSSSGASSSTSTTASASTSTTPSSSSSAAPVSMVSPSPAVTDSSSSGASSAGSTGSGPGAAPTSTIASTSPLTQKAQPAKIQSWTMYSVSVRFGKDLSVPVKNDVARLTPFPNVMAPQVMFMGVMSDGRSAVFALHAGVGHTGPGLCRPDHAHCSAIVLKTGQTEHLSVPGANGSHQDLVLRVVKIVSSITHSRRVALDAYHRVNDAGQCELDLANPVSYDSLTGTISSVVKNACQQHPNAVPFAYLVTAP